ncbi:hypothetical protein HAX54_041499 [Datura stramonium]|uniref:Uncharacterized protein n=1 Tax=Datura stramonium TaxID=4076 RepID=A0ABS8VS37_DATST|nr:hypothetical protein [Datura stramonium]
MGSLKASLANNKKRLSKPRMEKRWLMEQCNFSKCSRKMTLPWANGQEKEGFFTRENEDSGKSSEEESGISIGDEEREEFLSLLLEWQTPLAKFLSTAEGRD